MTFEWWKKSVDAKIDIKAKIEENTNKNLSLLKEWLGKWNESNFSHLEKNYHLLNQDEKLKIDTMLSNTQIEDKKIQSNQTKQIFSLLDWKESIFDINDAFKTI